MSEERSLINIGELSRPATVLVEKISDAIGGIFHPYQIKRIASAEAEARYIQTKSDIQISDLQRRALQRFLIEEGQKQENIESITLKALPHVSDQASPQDIEKDWIANFFDKCRLISDDEMQILWSRLLAGQANSPGKFSKRTVDLLASMDKKEAELFQKFISFIWNFEVSQPLIYDAQNSIYTKRKMNFYNLTHLDKIGLLSFDAIAGFSRVDQPRSHPVSYFGDKYIIDLPLESENVFHLGSVILTQAGREIASICQADAIPEFCDYVVTKWREMGYIVEPSI
jgi:Protein of unknown function (DUF2806)